MMTKFNQKNRTRTMLFLSVLGLIAFVLGAMSCHVNRYDDEGRFGGNPASFGYRGYWDDETGRCIPWEEGAWIRTEKYLPGLQVAISGILLATLQMILLAVLCFSDRMRKLKCCIRFVELWINTRLPKRVVLGAFAWVLFALSLPLKLGLCYNFPPLNEGRICGQVLFAGHVSSAAILIYLVLAILVVSTDFSEDSSPSTRTMAPPEPVD